MHEKYVSLHCSYSAPVRVLAIIAPSFDNARAVIAVKLRVADELVRVVVPPLRVVVDGCVVLTTVWRAVRGVSVVPRLADVLAVVFVRDWFAVVVVSLVLLVRETAVPSRTAASAMPRHITRFVNKTRSFFISGLYFSKNFVFCASE